MGDMPGVTAPRDAMSTSTSVKPSDSLIGSTVLGRYRILRKLARGGMGAVYLARTEGAAGFARPVVIKRILPTLMDDDEVAEMFVREARLLSNLQHPNIVTVVDFGQDPDGAYVMVLDYVHGYHLGQWHRYVRAARGAISADVALHIVGRVLDALHYAHTFRRSDGSTLEIVHRDVSPSNILLDVQGNVKLLDFGVARVSGDETTYRSHSGKQLTGKLPYLALELFKGEEPSARSDVYSCGVVLYELLSGQNPFAGRETADIYHRVLNVAPPPIHALRDDVPDGIDEVLSKAMHRDPKQRYQSAAQFAQAVRDLRSQPDEVVSTRLSLLLTDDFTSGMPEALSLEPLHVREQAWRNPSDAPPERESLPPGVGLPPPPAGLEPPPPEEATVRADMPAELLAAATREEPPTPTPLSTASAAAPAPVQGTNPWMAVGVLLALGLAAVAVGLNIHNARTAPVQNQERVVYLEALPQPAAQPTQPAPVAPELAGEPDPELEADEDPELEPDESEQPAVAPAKGAPEEAPAAPNPVRLTRRFGRHQKQVEACFAKHGSAGQPQLSIRFSLRTSGRVETAEVYPLSVNNTPLGRCLVAVATRTNFGPQQKAFSFRIPITAQRM